MIEMTVEEYQEHVDSDDGYCTVCNEVTRFGDTEPDAEKYPCPDCNGNTCMGIELAMVAGHIDIVDDD